MTATIEKQASWAKAIAKPATEFSLTQLSPISGTIPENLKGSLYRNGPGRLERGGVQVGHWFDGDGAILAVHFAEGQARATYRYVQTEGYLEETKANKLIFGNYGMVPKGLMVMAQFWRCILRKDKLVRPIDMSKLRDIWKKQKPTN